MNIIETLYAFPDNKLENKIKPNKQGELLNKMLVLATTKFDGIFDKGGSPYILHCLKVFYYLKTDDEELQCIGLGHDLVEDTDVTYVDLRNMGFSERIIEGIRAMTKVPGETNDEYLARIKQNNDAIRVKLADLRHNSDIRRLKGVTEKDILRIEKYHKMFLELKDLV
jgi:(p)ppGpp synthase/HD superfamily hydrolase